jgi:hypothetical protein
VMKMEEPDRHFVISGKCRFPDTCLIIRCSGAKNSLFSATLNSDRGIRTPVDSRG